MAEAGASLDVDDNVGHDEFGGIRDAETLDRLVLRKDMRQGRPAQWRG